MLNLIETLFMSVGGQFMLLCLLIGLNVEHKHMLNNKKKNETTF